MAQTFGTESVLVETVSGATHTLVVAVPVGTSRKVVAITAKEVAQTITALTFNGVNIFANLRASITHATATDLGLAAWDYDVSDGLADGNYNLVATTSGSTTNITLRAFPTIGTATGAPEDTDTQEGTSSTNVLTGTVTSTDNAALIAVYIDSAAGLTSVGWSGNVTESDEQNESNYTSSGADDLTSGAGTKTAVATPNTSAQDGNKLLLVLSYAAAATNPVVTSVDAALGPVAGGTNVTITGTTFDDTGGSSEGVTFGGAAATNVVFVNGTTITCTTPAHAVGQVDVVVTNGNGATGTGTDAFFYQGTAVVVNPGTTNGSGDATGTLTSTFWVLSGVKPRLKLTPTIGGVVCAPRCVTLLAP